MVLDSLPSGGFKRRALGALLIVLAALAVTIGIAESETAAIAAGGTLGGFGTGALL